MDIMKDTPTTATIRRDGKTITQISTGCKAETQLKVMRWFLDRHSYSMAWALAHEGYTITIQEDKQP